MGALVGSVVAAGVCRTHTSYSRFPAIALYYQVAALEEGAELLEVVRLVALVAVLHQLAHWHNEGAEEGCWS